MNATGRSIQELFSQDVELVFSALPVVFIVSLGLGSALWLAALWIAKKRSLRPKQPRSQSGLASVLQPLSVLRKWFSGAGRTKNSSPAPDLRPDGDRQADAPLTTSGSPEVPQNASSPESVALEEELTRTKEQLVSTEVRLQEALELLNQQSRRMEQLEQIVAGATEAVEAVSQQFDSFASRTATTGESPPAGADNPAEKAPESSGDIQRLKSLVLQFKDRVAEFEEQ